MPLEMDWIDTEKKKNSFLTVTSDKRMGQHLKTTLSHGLQLFHLLVDLSVNLRVWWKFYLVHRSSVTQVKRAFDLYQGLYAIHFDAGNSTDIIYDRDCLFYRKGQNDYCKPLVHYIFYGILNINKFRRFTIVVLFLKFTLTSKEFAYYIELFPNAWFMIITWSSFEIE